MNFNKRFVLLFISLILAFTFNFSAFASTPYNMDLSIMSESVYFVNLDTNTVVYDKNKDLKISASSLVKMMTVILTLEACNDENIETFLDKPLTAKQYIFDRLYLKNAATVDIRRGETISIRDAVYATMLSSASETAMMLADYISGDNTEDFVAKMNAKAKEIGMDNTVFADPDGLSDDNKSTAYDMYLLTEYCLQNPAFEKISTSASYMMGATDKHPEQRKIQHSNHMMSRYLGGIYYDERVRGVKTANFNGKKSLISLANDDKYRYLLVIMGAPQTEENNSYVDTLQLYKWAFKNLRLVNVGKPGEKMIPNNIKVNMGQNTDSVILTPKEEVIELLPKSINASTIFWDTSKLPSEINAPIKKGQVIGQVDLKLSDQVIRTVDVVADADIDINFLSFSGNIIHNVLFSWWFISIIVAVVLAILCIKIVRHSNRKNKVRRYSRSRRK